ncbi:MAG: S41 family peptidase, partial [Planctomycetota bacterium]
CSASASELLAGALQDLERGTLIGETTYGKGIGQSAVPLFSTSSMMGGGRGVDWGKGASPFMPNRFLYLTVMRYYLPSGRSIHHKGVVPDVEVALDQPNEGAFRAIRGLTASGAIGEYLDAQWDDHAEEFEALADYDDYSSEGYPEFASFYKGLETDLSEDAVRGAVRTEVRRRVAADRKKPFLTDLEADNQLQTGVLLLTEELEGK